MKKLESLENQIQHSGLPQTNQRFQENLNTDIIKSPNEKLSLPDLLLLSKSKTSITKKTKSIPNFKVKIVNENTLMGSLSQRSVDAGSDYKQGILKNSRKGKNSQKQVKDSSPQIEPL
jgi:hypothetical protein